MRYLLHSQWTLGSLQSLSQFTVSTKKSHLQSRPQLTNSKISHLQSLPQLRVSYFMHTCNPCRSSQWALRMTFVIHAAVHDEHWESNPYSLPQLTMTIDNHILQSIPQFTMSFDNHIYNRSPSSWLIPRIPPALRDLLRLIPPPSSALSFSFTSTGDLSLRSHRSGQSSIVQSLFSLLQKSPRATGNSRILRLATIKRSDRSGFVYWFPMCPYTVFFFLLFSAFVAVVSVRLSAFC